MFEIGQSLREARMRRGVEIAQAEEATKVRGKYLRALEEERFEVLPSQTYVKGFLRTYADYLGLDGQIYLDEYNSRFATGEDGEPRPRRSRPRPSKRNRRVETAVVLGALALITVGLLFVLGAWSSSKSNAPRHNHRPPATTTTKIEAAVPALSITAVGGDTYVAVRKDGPAGAVLFHDTISEGQTQAFNDGNRYWLNVPTPENLVIKVRGKIVNAGAYRPAVVTVTPTTWHVEH